MPSSLPASPRCFFCKTEGEAARPKGSEHSTRVRKPQQASPPLPPLQYSLLPEIARRITPRRRQEGSSAGSVPLPVRCHASVKRERREEREWPRRQRCDQKNIFEKYQRRNNNLTVPCVAELNSRIKKKRTKKKAAVMKTLDSVLSSVHTPPLCPCFILCRLPLVIVYRGAEEPRVRSRTPKRVDDVGKLRVPVI